MGDYKEAVSKNLPWKILSLVLGVLVWLIGMQVSNPEMSKSYDIELELRNMDKLTSRGLVLLNKDGIESEKIKVKIRSTRKEIEKINKATGVIKPFIDFETIYLNENNDYIEDYSLRINFEEGDISYNIIKFYPSKIKLELDKIEQTERTITVLKKGMPVSGFESRKEIEVTPKKISIKGAKGDLENISDIVAEVNLDKKKEDFTTVSALKVYDKNNKEITSKFELSVESVSLNIKMSKYDVIRVVTPKTKGRLDKNLNITDIKVSPKTIRFTGDEKILDSINEIIVPDIDISNIIYTTTMVYNVKELVNVKGIDTVEIENEKITVTIQVNKQGTKEITIPTEEFLLKGLKEGMYLEDELTIKIIGEESLVENIDDNDISVIVDLTGIEEGTTYVPVKIILPEKISLTTATEPKIKVEYLIYPLDINDINIDAEKEDNKDINEIIQDKDTEKVKIDEDIQ